MAITSKIEDIKKAENTRQMNLKSVGHAIEKRLLTQRTKMCGIYV